MIGIPGPEELPLDVGGAGGVGEGMGVGACVADGDGPGVLVVVEVDVGVRVCVAVAEGVGVDVCVAVAEGVGVDVCVAVAVDVGFEQLQFRVAVLTGPLKLIVSLIGQVKPSMVICCDKYVVLKKPVSGLTEMFEELYACHCTLEPGGILLELSITVQVHDKYAFCSQEP